MRIAFESWEPDDATEEEYEIAKQKVANLLDDPAWQWLKSRIFDERLSWPQIFDLVAARL